MGLILRGALTALVCGARGLSGASQRNFFDVLKRLIGLDRLCTMQSSERDPLRLICKESKITLSIRLVQRI